MRPGLWRWLERGLERRIAPAHLSSVLGDLLEDFGQRSETHGRLRAEVWILREYMSLARAYPHRRFRTSSPISLREVAMTDARLALRRLLLRPAASVASVITLACAIAAGATTWALIAHVLLDPLPVSAPERLVVVGEERQMRDGSFSRPSV